MRYEKAEKFRSKNFWLKILSKFFFLYFWKLANKSEESAKWSDFPAQNEICD